MQLFNLPLKVSFFLVLSYFSLLVSAASIPSSASVQLDSYNYDGSTFSGKIYVKNIAYSKKVTVIYADGSDNWNNNGNTIAASYSAPISGSNYEYWTFSASINGIKEFYIKYEVSGKTYYDNNNSANYQVSTSKPTTTTATATTTTAPSTSTTTPPSRSEPATFPTGNSTISSWIKKQEGISRFAMLRNINPPGSATGFIAASLSTAGPDYYYAWTRDAALTSNVIVYEYNTTLSGNKTILNVLKDYVTFSVKTQSTSTVCNCLGEPKFNPDASGYTGAWGRPQNDGPAERATTFILFADSYLTQTKDASYVTGTLKPAIFKDLDYVVNVWSNGCFDLWEEVNGVHFYTLMVMRKGLLLGADFAKRNGDSTRASTYSSTASTIANKISSFWVSSNNWIQVSQSVTGGVSKKGLDVSTLLAANLGSVDDGFFTPGSEKILATAVAVEDSFASLYPINKNLPSYLGNSIGRYPEDTYNGNGNSQGNSWFLAVTGYAELYYRAIKEWIGNGGVTVSSISLPFFKKFDSSATSGKKYTVGTSDFNNLAQNIALAADRFLSTVQLHAHNNGSLAEEFDRTTGLSTGARDLTWSHASLITASYAKAGAPAA
uniref:Glucoamylase 1 n=1 Tax=Rhizopus oryzae TaxID=64495 RepID=AMYG_RHIOR|nr:RecName: Full=Glucoamylase 1; Short=Gluc 1; AltName: Full=1,4-alpha-D-glucan glucohydrolase; AltName: Full=Glucan 1,4-alpha-glucosidase; Contains: RecName: Full=Glucoamylase 2; Short=Gluc 2; Contains: RecName: Full=Glucoamylase 3; Short=Gluc 3; Flags: Precursor [Rhizopus arrhizus]BAA00033.1 glucoamylase [Rhizopus arrhizus]BAP05656.1 glucoamylase [synthetic construct]